jgi:hypothetical protein
METAARERLQDELLHLQKELSELPERSALIEKTMSEAGWGGSANLGSTTTGRQCKAVVRIEEHARRYSSLAGRSGMAEGTLRAPKFAADPRKCSFIYLFI